MCGVNAIVLERAVRVCRIEGLGAAEATCESFTCDFGNVPSHIALT